MEPLEIQCLLEMVIQQMSVNESSYPPLLLEDPDTRAKGNRTPCMTYVSIMGIQIVSLPLRQIQKWPGIQTYFKQGQKAHDSPDLTVKAFCLKL